jgi:hypothetical protein
MSHADRVLLTFITHAVQMAIGESIISQMTIVDTLQEALASTTSKQLGAACIFSTIVVLAVLLRSKIAIIIHSTRGLVPFRQ